MALSTGTSSRHKSKALLLLVEDNMINAATMSHSLRLYGYEVLHASNGHEGLDMTRRHHPDLIIMDIQLPHMDGLEVTRKIRSKPESQHIPIIALTAIAMPGDRERCLEAGADEYLSKPVGIKELVRVIENVLEEKAASRAV